MLTITKRFEFCYGHSLPGYLGKCMNNHGHNAILEVEISGPPKEFSYQWNGPNSDYQGMVMDFSLLKEVVKYKILMELDHQWLNDEIEVPTAENIVMWIWTELESVFGEHLIRIRVSETSDSYAELKRC